MSVATLDFSLELAGFTDRLTQSLANDTAGVGLAISTFSILPVLSILLLGARNNTREQMKGAMFKAGDGMASDVLTTYSKHVHSNFAVANRLYLKDGFQLEPDFEKGVGILDDVLHRVPDLRGEVKNINDWVSDKTQDKVKEIISRSDVSALTKMIIVNAVYFKGGWKYLFDAKKTQDKPFTLADGSTVQVPMMELSGTGLGYYDQWDIEVSEKYATVLKMPFKENRYSMLFVRSEDAAHFETMKRNGSLFSKLAALDDSGAHNSSTNISIPKFAIEAEINLVDAMKRLGVNDLFVDGIANLSGIANTSLSVSMMKHKAVVEVDEEGAEAVAATVVVADLRLPPPKFVLDRPFFYAIWDDEIKALLFAGMVENPNKRIVTIGATKIAEPTSGPTSLQTKKPPSGTGGGFFGSTTNMIIFICLMVLMVFVLIFTLWCCARHMSEKRQDKPRNLAEKKDSSAKSTRYESAGEVSELRENRQTYVRGDSIPAKQSGQQSGMQKLGVKLVRTRHLPVAVGQRANQAWERPVVTLQGRAKAQVAQRTRTPAV